jgi:hypothetical protein
MHCKLPFTNIPNRSHKASASSIECAENIKHRLINLYVESRERERETDFHQVVMESKIKKAKISIS